MQHIVQRCNRSRFHLSELRCSPSWWTCAGDSQLTDFRSGSDSPGRNLANLAWRRHARLLSCPRSDFNLLVASVIITLSKGCRVTDQRSLRLVVHLGLEACGWERPVRISSWPHLQVTHGAGGGPGMRYERRDRPGLLDNPSHAR